MDNFRIIKSAGVAFFSVLIVIFLAVSNLLSQNIDNCSGEWEGPLQKLTNKKSKIVITPNKSMKDCDKDSPKYFTVTEFYWDVDFHNYGINFAGHIGKISDYDKDYYSETFKTCNAPSDFYGMLNGLGVFSNCIEAPTLMGFFDCESGVLTIFDFDEYEHGKWKVYYEKQQFKKISGINQNVSNNSQTIINLYNQSSSSVYTSPGDNNSCVIQADVDCPDAKDKAGRVVKIEFVNNQAGSFDKLQAITDAYGKAFFTFTAPVESALQGKDNITVNVKAVDVKSGTESTLIDIQIFKRDSKASFFAQSNIMPLGSKYYNEIKFSFNAPQKSYTASISTKNPLGLITVNKTDPNGSSPVVDNLVPGKVYTLYYHNTSSSVLSAPIDEEITLEIPELNIKKVINISVGMDLAIQTVERKYKSAVLCAVPEPILISVVDNFHPDADLEKIFDDYDIVMRARITPVNISRTSVMSKVQEEWISRALTKFEGFMMGGEVVSTSGDAVVTLKKSADGRYSVCKNERESMPFVMMFERGTYDFRAELVDIAFPDETSNNSGNVSLTVDDFKNEADEMLKTALIPMAKNMTDILTGGMMKYYDFAAASGDLLLYKNAVEEGRLQDAVIALFGIYCDKLETSKEFFNIVTKEVKPISENTKSLLKMINLASNAKDLTKLIADLNPKNKGGGKSNFPDDISDALKYSQLMLKGMKSNYMIVLDKQGIKNYSAVLKNGNNLQLSADKILNSKSDAERIEADMDYIFIPFGINEECTLSIDFNGTKGFLYRITKDKIEKLEFPKSASSVKVTINVSNVLSFGKQDEKKDEKSVSFAGNWETADFGTMTLIVSGNTVVGTCSKNVGIFNGSLSSDGTKFTGTWSMFPTYSSPNDAGKIEITISKDGKSFSGKWGKGTDDKGKLDKSISGKKK